MSAPPAVFPEPTLTYWTPIAIAPLKVTSACATGAANAPATASAIRLFFMLSPLSRTTFIRSGLCGDSDANVVGERNLRRLRAVTDRLGRFYLGLSDCFRKKRNAWMPGRMLQKNGNACKRVAIESRSCCCMYATRGACPGGLRERRFPKIQEGSAITAEAAKSGTRCKKRRPKAPLRDKGDLPPEGGRSSFLERVLDAQAHAVDLRAQGRYADLRGLRIGRVLVVLEVVADEEQLRLLGQVVPVARGDHFGAGTVAAQRPGAGGALGDARFRADVAGRDVVLAAHPVGVALVIGQRTVVCLVVEPLDDCGQQQVADRVATANLQAGVLRPGSRARCAAGQAGRDDVDAEHV